jgi:hypothetical protein
MALEEQIEQGLPAYIDEWVFDAQSRSLFIVFVRDPYELEQDVLGTLVFHGVTDYRYERLEEDTWDELTDEILAESLVGIVEPATLEQDSYYILTDAREVRVTTRVAPKWIVGKREAPELDLRPHYAIAGESEAGETDEEEEIDSFALFR